MNKQNFDQQLDNAVQTLPEQITPQRDLWRGIDQAIAQHQLTTNEQQPRNNKTPFWQWSGALTACIALVSVLTVTWQNPHQQLSAPIQQMAQNFSQDKQLLLTSYRDSRSGIANLPQQMSDLEQAEQAILQALYQDPNNPTLVKMLAKVYQQQLSLLNKAHTPSFQQI